MPRTLHFLNMQESTWLHSRSVPLRVGITQIPNQVLKTPSGYRGYAIDLFNKLAQKLGRPFTFVYYDTWDALMQAGKQREVDIVFFAQKTEKRLRFYNFTDIVMVQSNKIITAERSMLHATIEDLYGHKVAVVKGSAIAKYIALNFPQIELVPSKDEFASLNKILHQEADYTVAEPVRTGYYMKQSNIDTLYIAGDFPYQYKLRIATRNDIPIINIILNKALEQIDPAEMKALALKWGYEKEVYFDKILLLKILLIALVVILAALYLWILNRRLKEAQESLRQINATLEERIAQEVEQNRKKELIMLQQSRFAQMGQTLNMIAHQWRQPLNVLMNINQVLVFKYKRNNGVLTPEEVEDFSEKTTLQIQQMSQTIDDFRDFFRPRKEKQLLMLDGVIDRILEIIQPIFKAESIRLRFERVSGVCIEGYANELAQAIINLAYNAKDALVENDISDKEVMIRMQTKEQKVIVIVSDNAGGVPEAIIDEIFKPYFSTKEKKNGTGIGLYMSKMIIEKHMNGTLTVHNENGGAHFSVILDIKS